MVASHCCSYVHVVILTIMLCWSTAIALPPCNLQGRWTYHPPAAFDHQTQPAWTNEICVYQWIPSLIPSTSTTSTTTFTFTSPVACITDTWKNTPAIATVIRRSETTYLTIHFVDDVTLQNITHHGVLNDSCNFVDVNVTADVTTRAGLYTRVSTHPFFMPHHEWMSTTAGWLVRAAHITFDDGTRHLTPGYPTHYNGQWMRDGFYGISLLWPLASQRMRLDYWKSMVWLFGRVR